jgi:hypothetical protein
MKPTDLLLCFGFALMLVIYIIQLYFIKRLLDELKTRFNDQWMQLGKPSLVFNNSLNNNLVLFSFLWHRKYLDLEDDAFSRRCLTVRTFSIFSIIFAIAWVTSVLVIILLTKE